MYEKTNIWLTDKRFIFAWENASEAKGEHLFKVIQLTVDLLKLTQEIDEGYQLDLTKI